MAAEGSDVGTVVALGELALVEGYGLAGAVVTPAETDDEVLRAWSALPGDGHRGGAHPARGRGPRVCGARREVADERGAAMRALHEDASAALEPLRAALRAAAQAEADRIIGAAEEEATAVLDAARAQAEQIIAAATAEGAATARAAAALHSARVRREAHELLLAEQESLRRELERRVVLAAQDLGGDPRHAAWLDRLTARCREALGASGHRHAEPGGRRGRASSAPAGSTCRCPSWRLRPSRRTRRR